MAATATDDLDAIISGQVERVKKYTKKWASRFCTFDPKTRKFTYSESESETAKAKAFLTLTKVIRCAETREGLLGQDLFSMILEGHADGDSTKPPEQWNMRFLTDEAFEEWYAKMRRSLATAGLGEPYNHGLPKVDPRQGLPFARVPLTHLHKFGLLDKAIVYAFVPVRFLVPIPGSTTPTSVDGVFVVGDKYIYLFRTNADVVRCTSLINVVQLFYTKGNDVMGIVIKAPEPDIALHVLQDIEPLKHAMSVQYRAMAQGKALAVTPNEDVKLETLFPKLRNEAGEGYKLEVGPPTSKARLRHALDQYEQQHGTKFDPATHKQKKALSGNEGKRTNSVDVPSGASSPNSGGAAGAAKADMSIPLVRLLAHLNLLQYSAQLLKQHVDIDVLQCMDLTDLETFGVKIKEHGQQMLNAANDSALVASILSGSTTTSSAAPAVQGVVLATDNASQPVLGSTTTTHQSSAASPVTPQRASAITLSDDDDDLDALVQTASSRKPIIVLDDSDDDLDLLPPVLPASPSGGAQAAKKPIILDDDDDI